MPNPTRQEIIRAYGTLSFLWDCLEVGWKLGASTIESSKSNIEKVLPPRPQLTMAEIEWNDDEHFLAEAEDESCSSVIMLQQSKETGNIQAILKGTIKSYLIYQRPEHLTPTGKRYTLTEVQE